jgi:ABC-type phosphate/phosphonate transport system permease subunit
MAPLIRFVEEAEPVPETWQVIGSVLVGFVLAALFAICLALFFTGLWVWSLLI